MQLQVEERELAAIGASIGANCRPCIEHHLAAGREAGLTKTEMTDAVATAQAVGQEAVMLLSARVDELLGQGGSPPEPGAIVETSRRRELVALGASFGANSHPLLHLHVAAALDAGLTPAQVKAALKMAEYVQRRAAEITADKAANGLDEASSAPAGVAAGTFEGTTR